MPFRKNDPALSRIARWCNRKDVFWSTSWDEYLGSMKKEIVERIKNEVREQRL